MGFIAVAELLKTANTGGMIVCYYIYIQLFTKKNIFTGVFYDTQNR